MVRSVDQEAVRKAWGLQREGKSQDEIALAINRSLRQTSRYLSRKWLKERNLEHLAYSEPAMSYLEREAKGRCERGDHSFMEDRRFEGQLYTFCSHLHGRCELLIITSKFGSRNCAIA